MLWIGFAFALFVLPFLAVRFALRDRANFRPGRFVLLVVIFLWPVFGIVFYEAQRSWFRGLQDQDEAVFFAVLIALILATPLLLLARRFMGMKWSKRSPGFRAALLLIIGAVVVGTLINWLDGEVDFDSFLGYSMIAVPVLLLVSFVILAARRKGVPERVVGVRLLIPCYLTSLVILGFLSKVLYLEEKYWVARNPMWEATAEYPTKAWEVALPRLKQEQSRFLEELPPVRTEQ